MDRIREAMSMLSSEPAESLAARHQDVEERFMARAWPAQPAERNKRFPVAFHIADPSYEGRNIFAFPASYVPTIIEKPGYRGLWVTDEEGKMMCLDAESRITRICRVAVIAPRRGFCAYQRMMQMPLHAWEWYDGDEICTRLAEAPEATLEATPYKVSAEEEDHTTHDPQPATPRQRPRRKAAEKQALSAKTKEQGVVDEDEEEQNGDAESGSEYGGWSSGTNGSGYKDEQGLRSSTAKKLGASKRSPSKRTKQATRGTPLKRARSEVNDEDEEDEEEEASPTKKRRGPGGRGYDVLTAAGAWGQGLAIAPVDMSLVEICTFHPHAYKLLDCAGRFQRNQVTPTAVAKAINQSRGLSGDNQVYANTILKMIEARMREKHGAQWKQWSSTQEPTSFNYNVGHFQPNPDLAQIPLADLGRGVTKFPSGRDAWVITPCVLYAQAHPEENLMYPDDVPQLAQRLPNISGPHTGVNEDDDAVTRMGVRRYGQKARLRQQQASTN
ncbi:hypothetical protein W97_02803 [Coniosporium apollinis CBS 100218]|uniref:Uncharacterized protein n=1 Tax=Coniosporium apollinis (strain CBS 100218) TaxID=1168221 RepID=R7YNT4_CONA1|nr:uncharacterized protein W97_02803 [Coniosporium apollinis CBS 100218]EON63575.1 hypothetical protein W97_02803 [Coniosporium apollinis CBS 100218]